MFKRIALFAVTNIIVVITISLILNLLGVRGYITAQGINYSSLLVFCLVWGMVGSFISLAMSKFMAKNMMGVEILKENGPYTGLVNRVHRLAKAAGLNGMPEVGIYHSPDVNAFATGMSRNNSLVAVSSGLLNTMTDDEVEGVLAHEISHIANGDMVTMALVQGVINAFVMFFARIAAFALQNVLRGDDDERASFGGGLAYMLTTFVFELIFGFIGMFIVAFFSRYREYRADSGAAKLAGREKMIAALNKLRLVMQNAPDLPKDGNKAFNAFKISSRKGLLEFLSTHPPLEDRIKALEYNAR